MYKVDTHIHTSEVSVCGEVDCAALIEAYKKKGFDALIITDHYYKSFFEGKLPADLSWEDKEDRYLAGYKKAKKLGAQVGIEILLGLELRFLDIHNDYLVYGVDEEFLKEYPELYKYGLERFSKLAKEKGLLIFQAHPFRPGMTREHPELIDGMEVYNGHSNHESNNDEALNYATANNLKLISGTDFHKLGDEGNGGVILDRLPTTSKEFVDIFNSQKQIELIRS